MGSFVRDRGFLSPPPLFPALLIVFFLHVVGKSEAADVALGSVLRPAGSNATWVSPNGTFSLGFFPAAAGDGSLFVAAIALAGGIRVWTAGESNSSGAVDAAGSLELRTDGNLRLVNGSGAVVWESRTGGKGVTVAALRDSGNFELSNGSAVVWDTFSNPTDTVLQTQSLAVRGSLRSGPYSFALLSNGNLTLRWNNTVLYYNKGLNTSVVANVTLTSPRLTLQTNGILTLSDPSLPTAPVIAYSSDYGDTGDLIRYLRLDGDGNLRAYSSVKGSGQETPRWSAVADQCEVFGWCGNMGVCSYNDTEPVCGCPSQNFEFVDAGDPRQGCRRKQEIRDCPGNSTMLELDHTQFLTYPPDINTEVFFVGITACRQNCLSGFSCVASTSLADGSGLCYLKVSSFVSGYQSRALPSTSFVKVCGQGIPNQSPSNSERPRDRSSKPSAGIIAVVVVGTILALVALESALWWCFCRNSPKYGPSSAQYALLEYASGAPVQFSYKELHRSTKGFKEKLGEGGFGAVYRGVLANRTVVAVKQLEGIEQGEKQFRMEVATISSTHHLNLVRLIGFCSEGRHRLLVYEFMKNGSLDSFLFSSASSSSSSSSSKLLSWETRYGVALGTARGITYLHEECRDCIVHCDIKPENILLDEGYNAKVSDFGLAKLVHPKDHRHRTLTSVRGTRGYLAPEWLANLPITSKSDVYSYGMVLLEIVSGRRNFDVAEDTGRKKFSAWAYEEFERGNLRGIMDRRLAQREEVDMEQLGRAIQVSFWCIQEQPSQRPTMGKVVQMLEGIMEIERPPAPKATEGPLSITSGSGSVSLLSTFAASAAAPIPSSSELAPATSGISSASRRHTEKTSSSMAEEEQTDSALMDADRIG